jgi:uncharacterized protein YoxC
MINKLIIAFCIIAWVVIIPYMMHDIDTTLDNCQNILEQINER